MTLEWNVLWELLVVAASAGGIVMQLRALNTTVKNLAAQLERMDMRVIQLGERTSSLEAFRQYMEGTR